MVPAPLYCRSCMALAHDLPMRSRISSVEGGRGAFLPNLLVAAL